MNPYTIVALRALADNYIWLIHDRQNAVVVDPTTDQVVITYLRQQNLKLSAILLTHTHADHTGGVAGLSAKYHPQVIDNFAGQLLEHQQLCLAGLPPFAVLLTPGHTFEHVCYLLDQRHLFCGDTLFAQGCGRVFTNDFEAMYSSLMKIKALADQVFCYPAHEYTAKNLEFTAKIACNPQDYLEYQTYLLAKLAKQQITLPTSLGDEKKYNLFLRCQDTELWSQLAKQGTANVASALECFTSLRKLRNDF